MDELVDGALVAGLHAAQRPLRCLFDGDELRLIAGVGRCTDHVKLCGCVFIQTPESDFLRALGDVQAVLAVQVILGAVRLDDAGAVADIEDADLTALQEELRSEVRPDIDPLVDGDFLLHRHAAQGDHAVDVGVHRDDLVRLVETGDQEFVPGLFRGIALEILLIAGISDIHLLSLLLLSDAVVQHPGPGC